MGHGARQSWRGSDGLSRVAWEARLMAFVGRSVPRLEDPPLVTGQGRFAADISFAHQLHMRVVRSAHAHGRIVAIDAQAARAADGVVAVWTAADVADIPPIDFRLTRIEGLEPYRQPILATDRVRYVGEPVAVVFAADPYYGRGRRRPGDGRDRAIAGIARGRRAARRICRRPFHRSRHRAQRLWRRDSSVCLSACGRRTRIEDRTAQRRAAGNARRHRTLRCGA